LTLVFVAATVLCTIGPAYAISFGGPGGKWPQSWPKELEPLRKQAWTWEHGFGGMSYDIPFANRKEFEAAWPHILTLKSKGASITLLRGPHLRVEAGKTAGVRVVPPRDATSTVTSILLVVDGEIVDLNRIPLPADTPIVDERFKDEDRKAAAGKAK
jgi:hypothetical protein